MPTVELGIAQSLGEALGLTFIDTATEGDQALNILPLTGKQSLLDLPHDIVSILGPRWKLHFFFADTGEESEVYADENFTLRHALPVVLDRFANIPGVYLAVGIQYLVVVENQYGVLKQEFLHTNKAFSERVMSNGDVRVTSSGDVRITV